MNEDDGITREAIEQEYPDREAWQGIDSLWHARIRGATPPVMVHGEDLVDLRDQVKRAISGAEMRARRPEGATP